MSRAFLRTATPVWLLGLLLAGCQRRPPRLAVTFPPRPAAAAILLARDQGLIDRRRIDPELRSAADADQAMRAYIAGQTEAIATTLPDVVTICGLAPERCPVIVYVIAESRGADQLLAAPGIGSLAALAGNPVAVGPGSLGRILLARALASAGLPPPDPARLRGLPPPAALHALRRATVAALVGDPLLADTGAGGGPPLVPLFSTRQLPGEILEVLAVDPDTLRRDGDAVAALVAGWQQLRSAEFQRPLAMRAALARRLGLDAERLRALTDQLRTPGFQEQYELLDPRQNNLPPVLERIRRVLDGQGVVPSNTPLPATDDAIIRRLAAADGADRAPFPG